MDKNKRGLLNWLLWWRVDPAQLQLQLQRYPSYGIFNTARGVACLCMLFTAVITGAFVAFGVQSAHSLLDTGLAAGLALFIYLGHRWAMLAAMAYWTISKVVALISSDGAVVISHLLWWCGYMHAFWLAFQVERARRQREALAATSIVFD